MECSECGVPLEASEDATAIGLCPDCAQRAGTTRFESVRRPPASEATPPTLPDRFEVHSVLGKGSFGIVRKCWDSVLRRFVAIKSPLQRVAAADLLIREARAASRLRHPSIVRVLDAGEHGDTLYVVSELVDGETLKEWAQRTSPDPLAICRMLVPVARGVQVAHEAGIVHRDLKPSNIMVDREGNPQILDFGLSRSVHSATDTLMLPGRRIGTPAFMAPEQVQCQADQIDARTDVYALGVILFQLLTGELPYRGQTSGIFAEVAGTAEAPLANEFKRSVPVPLARICNRAMAKQRDRRYQSAGDFADDLQGYLDGRRVRAAPGWYGRRVRMSAMRGWPLLALLLLAGILLWMKHQRDRMAARLDPRVDVIVDTVPAGALLEWFPVDAETGLLAAAPVATGQGGSRTNLPAGFYLVRASAGGESLDVFRTVPAGIGSVRVLELGFAGVNVLLAHRSSTRHGNRVKLPAIRIPPVRDLGPGMVFVPGGTIFVAPDQRTCPQLSGQQQTVGAFLIDPQEVRWSDLCRQWPGLNMPDGQSLDDPATRIPWDIAVAWCELRGGELPSVWEYCLAATNGGTTLYPWGDQFSPDQASGNPAAIPAELDHCRFDDRLTGLVSGPDEWTATVYCPLITIGGELRPLPGESSGAGFPKSWLVVDGQGKLAGDDPRIARKVWFCEQKLPDYPIGFRSVRRLPVSNPAPR